MRMKDVTAVLQTGQVVSCVLPLQSLHMTRWPHGIAACVALADMHIWHSGSLLVGGAEGAELMSCASEEDPVVGGDDMAGAGARWQLMLWLPSDWH